MCWLGWAREGPYQGGGDPGVETQQAHVLLHGAVYHQPQFPSDLPHQLPVDCEDRRTVRALQATCQPRPQPSSSSPLCAARPPSGVFRAPCLHLAQPGLTHALACEGLHGGAPGLGGKEDPTRTEACLSPQPAWWGWKKGIQPREHMCIGSTSDAAQLQDRKRRRGGILRTASLTCPLLGTYRAHSSVSQ